MQVFPVWCVLFIETRAFRYIRSFILFEKVQ